MAILSKVCPGCSSVFETGVSNKIWCTKECYQANSPKFYRPNPNVNVKHCEQCGVRYKATAPRQRWCGEECRTLGKIAEESKRPIRLTKRINARVLGKPKQKHPRGYYVYGWRDGDSLPFYIGKGISERAWIAHGKPGTFAECDKVRASCSNFNVVVYRDKLTAEGAFLLESVLITVFKDLGAPLVNVHPSMLRPPKKVLELYG